MDSPSHLDDLELELEDRRENNQLRHEWLGLVFGLPTIAVAVVIAIGAFSLWYLGL